MLVHPLEPRLLLAADPVFQLTSKGTLIIHGSDKADEIVVYLKHNSAADGVEATVTLDKASGTNKPQDFGDSYKAIKRYRIDAGGGDDFINISGDPQMTRPATILGGAGNDLINYSRFAPTLVDAGDGNDQLAGALSLSTDFSKNREVLDATFAKENTTSVATLLGGAGDDTLNADTNDKLDGGDGNDTANIIVYGNNVSADRRNALAHDYYSRLGATGIEQPKGNAPAFAVSPIAGSPFDIYKAVSS